MKKNIVFGLGTGRCGTMSLANLLNYQNDSSVSHELNGTSLLPWEPNIPQFDRFMRDVLRRKEKTVGDVSFYSLSYVNILMNRYDDVKIVVMKRDKKETIKSYMKKTMGRNHWMHHDGSEWRLDIWDRCYPKFDVKTKEEALSCYYDHYYELCKQLPQEKCFWLQSPELNDESKCLEMLEFCEIESPRFKIFKKNKGK